MEVKPHKKLIVWQKAVEIAKEVYNLTEEFPKEERFGLAQQMRSAAVSVASNIAEGAGRSSRKEKVQFFTVARGSLSELDKQLEILKGLNFANKIGIDSLFAKMEETSRMLNGLIKSKRLLLVMLLLFIATSLIATSLFVDIVSADIVWEVKETGVDFLRLGVGGRATALGESYVALGEDIFSSYWNPAGLAKIEKPELGLMHSVVPVNALLEFVGFAYPVKKTGTFGFSGFFQIPESVPVTDNVGKVIGEVKWLNYALTLSYARKIRQNFSLGLSLKMVEMRESDPIFGGTKGTAYAGDLGILYETPVKGLNFGFAFLNYGSKLQMEGETKKDDLPRTIKTGFAYKLDLIRGNHLVITLDENKVLDDRWRTSVGSEIAFLETIFLRFGFYEKQGNVTGTTYGLGIKFKNYGFDFTNVPVSQMIGYERTNKFSLVFNF